MAVAAGTIIQEVILRTDRLVLMPGIGFVIALHKGESLIEFGKTTYRPDEKREK